MSREAIPLVPGPAEANSCPTLPNLARNTFRGNLLWVSEVVPLDCITFLLNDTCAWTPNIHNVSIIVNRCLARGTR